MEVDKYSLKIFVEDTLATRFYLDIYSEEFSEFDKRQLDIITNNLRGNVQTFLNIYDRIDFENDPLNRESVKRLEIVLDQLHSYISNKTSDIAKLSFILMNYYFLLQTLLSLETSLLSARPQLPVHIVYLEGRLIRFNWTRSTDPNAPVALQEYSIFGQKLRQDPCEELIAIDDLFSNLGATSWIATKLGELQVQPQVDQMFIAITAPSYTGKTQLAFSLINVKPLYFVLDPFDIRDQPIYKNFYSLSAALIRLAMDDLEEIRLLPRNIPLYFYDLVSSTNLITELKDHPFRVIGFLNSLIQDSAIYYRSESNDNWMHFFAERPEPTRSSLEFAPMSISNFLNSNRYQEIKGKFIVFLDEFSGHNHAVFLRNICRSIGLGPSVASTNSQVANLIGKSSARRSRIPSESTKLWGTVITRLPPSTEDFFFSHFDLEPAFVNILQLASDACDEAETLLFLNYLRDDQFVALRPGIASKIAILLQKTFARPGGLVPFTHQYRNKQDKRFSLVLLEFLLQGLATEIVGEKQHILLESGSAAQLALLSSEAYSSSIHARSDEEFKPSFVDKHLFHLLNPDTATNPNMFLIFPNFSDEKAALKFYNENELLTDLFYKSVFFDSEELLILTCYFIGHLKSTSEMMKGSVGISRTSDASSIDNPEDISRSGKLLENETLYAFSDASHFQSLRVPTLSGISGDVFLNNIVRNFVKSLSNERVVRIEVGSGVGELGVRYSPDLSQFQIPFLFVSNRLWPYRLGEVLCSSAAHFGTYIRTRTNDQIDAVFDIRAFGEESFSVIECKNYQTDISVEMFYGIIGKCVNYYPSCQLQFTVCNSVAGTFGSITDANINLLYNECKDYNVNIFRIVPKNPHLHDQISSRRSTEPLLYDLIPYRDDFYHCPTPKLLVIVIELDQINGLL